jgi:hypothetical protein
MTKPYGAPLGSATALKNEYKPTQNIAWDKHLFCPIVREEKASTPLDLFGERDI